MSLDPVTGECTDLLVELIRNRCVNDGTPDSGGETRNARLIAGYLADSGLDIELVEPHPGRGSLIATLPGPGGAAGGLVLLGHTDVVDASDADWSVPPFEGRVTDGIVWGRGAVDMLGMTASMAVALRNLARGGWRPTRDLTLVAVADEEAGGRFGAGWLADNWPEVFAGRSVLAESGGFPLPSADGPRLECFVGEKGALGATVSVHGSGGHGAFPYRVDSAVHRLPEVLRRLAAYEPEPEVDGIWREYVEGMALPARWRDGLLKPETFAATLESVPVGLARYFHAITRTTVTPTVVSTEGQRNLIPDRVDIELDVRVFPGRQRSQVEQEITAIFAGLDQVSVRFRNWRTGTRSRYDTPLWRALEQTCADLMPAARMVPAISAATTDAKHVRPLDAICYGFGLFSERIPADEYFQMFHGVDERIDQQSLRLLVDLWQGTATRLLTPEEAR